ncbi:MAG: tripartite tricarboxylate transporter permease [Alphaproteobacteria bacterium]|nr:tripartite tricarboxylate transporter permease [Alphaproteobacteria bacterium]
MQAFGTALSLVFTWQVMITILLSSVFGLLVGAIPGLTATMATALLVPFAFMLDPVSAIAAIVSATAMAIFAGDIPGCLLRLPGTPASAAYTEEAYAMTKGGQAGYVLGTNLLFSALGGLFGTVILVTSAPLLAEYALSISHTEYFWLSCLGLTCAIFVATDQPLKGAASLLLGLFIATIGRDYTTGFVRFTFGESELIGGVSFVPALIGLFAIPEILRTLLAPEGSEERIEVGRLRIFAGFFATLRRYWSNFLRSSVIGTAVGALPGAGADIAAWTSYAVSKKMTREPEKWGRGHIEGIVDATSANNAALSGAWIPALVFAIPGDSITAIAIGVMYLKNVNPGPTIFLQNAHILYAVFIVFFVANLLMIPLGWLAIRASTPILRIRRKLLMPVLLLFCVLGAYAIDNNIFGVVIMLVLGLIGYVMEESGFPVSPAVLGIVMGQLVEQNLMTSLIKTGGNLIGFFDRPLSAVFAAATLLIWGLSIGGMVRRRLAGARP